MKRNNKKSSKIKYNKSIFRDCLESILYLVKLFCKKIITFANSIMDISKFHGYCFWLICGYVAVVLFSCSFVAFKNDILIDNKVINNEAVYMTYSTPIGPPAKGTEEAQKLEQILNEYNNSIVDKPAEEQVEVLEEPEVPAVPVEDATVVETEPSVPKKRVYLTFDDGPSNATIQVLDILKENNVKATFFTIAKNGAETDAIYNRIVNEGHTLGMHSYTHRYSEIYSSSQAFINDVNNIQNHIKIITGQTSVYYRFPGGSAMIADSNIKDEVLNYMAQQQIRYYDWNVLNGDAASADRVLTEEELIANIINGISDKQDSIVLMHDTDEKTATVNSLPELIRQLKELDVELLPINEDTPMIQQVKSLDNVSQ